MRYFLVLLTVCFVAVGCSRPSYINVPDDGNDSAINGPNWETTIRIQKAALAYLLEQSSIPGDVVLQLPKGTSEATTLRVAYALKKDNVFTPGATPSDEFQVVEVRKIEARGAVGRVDIIRPGELRERELVEVHMVWSVLDGWQADYMRVRNIDVNRIDPMQLAAPGHELKESDSLLVPIEEEKAPVEPVAE